MFESGQAGGDRAEVRPGRSVLELAFASLLTTTLEVEHVGRAGHGASADGSTLGQATLDAAASVIEAPEAPEIAPVDRALLDQAAALASADLADLEDGALVDAVVAWQHVASWAAAGQARVVGELLARGGASSRALEATTHELTAALVTSRHTASALVGRAAGLSESPAVADALADGRIDTARADALITAENVPPSVRRRVVADLVGTAAEPGPATGLTPRQLRDRLRRAAIDADPEGAARRATTAAAERHVWVDPAPDQMAWLTAYLPATDAARIWARIDGAARRGVRLPGEERTLGQLRADALTQLVTTTTTTTTGGPGPDAGAGDPDVADDRPVPIVPVPMVSALVNVTVAATTLLGLDETPAQLAGYGPVPAPVARALASGGDATWRRILTDPATGAATDVSRTAYRPGVVLGELVRVREPVCTFPGCHVPAERCDLDHLEPFDSTREATGQTRASNLHPVCRSHHNAKTHGGWSTSVDEDDGTITWTAPSGHEYHVPPTSSDPCRVAGAVGRGGRTPRDGAPDEARKEVARPPGDTRQDRRTTGRRGCRPRDAPHAIGRPGRPSVLT